MRTAFRIQLSGSFYRKINTEIHNIKMNNSVKMVRFWLNKKST